MALELRSKLGHPPPQYILVKMDILPEVTKGGIVIPKVDSTQYAQSAVSTGIVAEIGACCWEEIADGRPWAKVGDRVYFEKYQGQEYKFGEELYRTMRDYSIRMVLPQEEFSTEEA